MDQHFSGKVAAKAIIVREGKILMTRDHRDNELWDLPGGRINAQESLESGLKREILEELGVGIKINGLVYSEQLTHTSDGSPHLFVTFKTVLIDPDQKMRVSSEELDEVKWVDQNAIRQLKIYDNCLRALNAFWQNS